LEVSQPFRSDPFAQKEELALRMPQYVVTTARGEAGIDPNVNALAGTEPDAIIIHQLL
jgi:hypothetical protein